MAHKKAAGSAKNLRDSNAKFRGVKLFGGQLAKAGNIIIRQKGDKYQLGTGVYKGSDFTIHAAVDGVVSFTKKNVKRYDGRSYLKTVVEVTPMHVVHKPTEKKEVKKKKKKAVTKTAQAHTDDLTKIEGIGPKINEVFHANGILTYDDLSSAKIGDLRDILANNDLSQHDPKTWKKQATLAKNGKWDELQDLQNELHGGK